MRSAYGMMTTEFTTGPRNPLVVGRSEGCKEFVHALQSAIKFGHRSGVGNPDMLAGAEAFAGNSCNMRLAQQSARQIRSRLDAAAPDEPRDVRIGIERALGQCALHARDRTQS